MAFNFKGEWLGLKAVEKRLSDYSETVQKNAAQVIAEGALAIHEEARRSIQKIASKGAERPDGSSASKPGFPPNTDTGRLVQSIGVDIDLDKARAKVSTNLEYAAPLEFGTSKMAPRPFLAPAYAKFRDGIIKNLKKVLKLKK